MYFWRDNLPLLRTWTGVCQDRMCRLFFIFFPLTYPIDKFTSRLVHSQSLIFKKKLYHERNVSRIWLFHLPKFGNKQNRTRTNVGRGPWLDGKGRNWQSETDIVSFLQWNRSTKGWQLGSRSGLLFCWEQWTHDDRACPGRYRK